MDSFSLLKLCSLRYSVIYICNISLGNVLYFAVGLLEFIKVFTPTLLRVFTLLTDVSHQGSRPAVSSTIVQKFQYCLSLFTVLCYVRQDPKQGLDSELVSLDLSSWTFRLGSKNKKYKISLLTLNSVYIFAPYTPLSNLYQTSI